MPKGTASQEAKTFDLVVPVAQTPGTVTGTGIDCRGYEEAMINLHAGIIPSNGTLDVHLELGKDATAEEALAAMQAASAGQAEAYGNTYKGAQEKMNTAVGNLKETLGAALIGPLAKFTTWLADAAIDYLPKVEAFIKDPFIPTLTKMYDWFNDKVVPVLTTVGLWLGVNLPVAAKAMVDFWNDPLMPILSRFADFVKDPVLVVLGWLWDKLGLVINLARDAWEWLQKLSGAAGDNLPTITTPEGKTAHPFGFAQGGQFLTTGPTMFLAGEGADAETVSIQPQGKAPVGGYTFIYNDYGGGNYASAKQMTREMEYRYRMGLS